MSYEIYREIAEEEYFCQGTQARLMKMWKFTQKTLTPLLCCGNDSRKPLTWIRGCSKVHRFGLIF